MWIIENGIRMRLGCPETLLLESENSNFSWTGPLLYVDELDAHIGPPRLLGLCLKERCPHHKCYKQSFKFIN
jgi:hypothetical protein